MLIAEFAQHTGLTRDAVRFYVKHGLLRPRIAQQGNRYQHFEAADVQRAVVIQTARALGFTIREIVALSRELDAGGMSTPRQIEVLRQRLAELELQAHRLKRLRTYLQAKIRWMERGGEGPEPRLALVPKRPRRAGHGAAL